MPVVALIGQPNTGKSSLFNRLTSTPSSIIDDTPGVTRDVLYGTAEHGGRSFYLIDTGGIFGTDTEFSEGIRAHASEAVSECDAVIFMVDGKTGITAPDEEIADLLRKSGKPVVVAVNKLDDPKHDDTANDAYTLGFENVIGISALHKRGLYELLDLVVSLLPDEESPAEESFTLTTTIAGRPNVGKSSLLNKLCGYDRALVSPVAGTTRDPVDTTITYNGDAIRIIDTAGLRRRAKFDSALEYYSYVRTLSALDRSDTAIMMMDANDPCTTQDKRIISQIVEKGKGLVLVLNKWDMMKGEGKAAELMKKVREEMPFVSYAPILLTSALTGRGVQKVLDALLTVNVNRGKRIPTSGLNRLMRDVLAFDRLPSDRKGKTLKVYYCSQAEVNPPTFIFFVNNPELVSSSFDNHVVNKLRTLEDFSGTPIRTHWKGRSENEA